MITFLEYTCRRLMGAPLRFSGGRAIWPCPECDDQTAFGTLPHRPQYKDRVMCHRCGFRGDAADVVRFFNPREGWPARRARLDQWRIDWEREIQDAATDVDGSKVDAPLPFPGRGSIAVPDYCSPSDIQLAWACLHDDLREIEVGQAFALQIMELIDKRCRANRVSFSILFDYSRRIWDAQYEMLDEHAADCRDPLCGNTCRLHRGLAPLTPEQRAALEAEQEEGDRQRRERIQRAIRRNGRA